MRDRANWESSHFGVGTRQVRMRRKYVRRRYFGESAFTLMKARSVGKTPQSGEGTMVLVAGRVWARSARWCVGRVAMFLDGEGGSVLFGDMKDASTQPVPPCARRFRCRLSTIRPERNRSLSEMLLGWSAVKFASRGRVRTRFAERALQGSRNSIFDGRYRTHWL